MNDRMNAELERTIEKLRSSMPSPQRKSSFKNLLFLATHEIRPLYFSVSILLAIFLGYIGTKVVETPMLTCFCTAPVPLLLLFCKYVWRDNKSMHQLEQTFRYSFTQMLTARMTILTGFCLISLLALSTAIYSTMENISFIRAILSGLMPLTIVSGILLMCAGKMRENELTMVSCAIWILLSFMAIYINTDVFLSGCSLIILVVTSLVGVSLNIIGIKKIQKHGVLYAV